MASPPQQPQQTSSDCCFETTFRYRTYALKVYLHCQACAKRVTKILKNIDGVYIIEVNYVYQIITVHGNVEVETLTKAIQKRKKYVEVLWPEQKADPKDVRPSKPKSKEEQTGAAEAPEKAKGNQGCGGRGGDKGKGKESMKAEVVEVKESVSMREKKFEAGSYSYNMKMEEEVIVGKPLVIGKGVLKAETGNLPSQSPPPVVVAEKQQSGGGEKTGGAGGNGSSGDGGGGSKKENGKELNSNKNVKITEAVLLGNAPSTYAPPAQPAPQPLPQPVAQAMPQPVPQPMPQPQPHPYGMYYHAVLPSTSYADEPLFCETQTYTQWGLGSEAGQAYNPYFLGRSLPFQVPQPNPQSHPYSPSVSADSFAYFSDENPNACSVM